MQMCMYIMYPQAVHSEYEKNLTSDSRRLYAVQTETANPSHPWSRFGRYEHEHTYSIQHYLIIIIYLFCSFHSVISSLHCEMNQRCKASAFARLCVELFFFFFSFFSHFFFFFFSLFFFFLFFSFFFF